MTDASIAETRYQHTEFVSPICTWDDIETLQAIIWALRHAGAGDDPSCGIYAHIGVGDHNAKTLQNLVNIINAHEKLLKLALKISEERCTN